MSPNAQRIMNNIINAVQEAEEMSGIEDLDEYIEVMTAVFYNVQGRIANATALKKSNDDSDPYEFDSVHGRGKNV